MDRQIHEVAAVCDYVQALRRSSKRIWLSFDEWNVWYRARSGDAVDGRRAVRAAAARGGLQPRGRAARRRLRQHAAAERGPGPSRLPRAARQRDRAARDQRDRRAPPEHLLSLRVGSPLRARPRARRARRGGDVSHFRRRVSRPTSPATIRFPSSMSIATLDAQNGQASPADAQSRSGRRPGAGARVGRRDADSRARVRDADRSGSQGVQHVRPSPAASRRSGSRHPRQEAG